MVWWLQALMISAPAFLGSLFCAQSFLVATRRPPVVGLGWACGGLAACLLGWGVSLILVATWMPKPPTFQP